MTRWIFNAFILLFITLIFTVKTLSLKHVQSCFIAQACCELSIESSTVNQSYAHHHQSDDEMDAHASAEAASEEENNNDNNSEKEQVEEFLSVIKPHNFDIFVEVNKAEHSGLHPALVLANYFQQIDRPPMS